MTARGATVAAVDYHTAGEPFRIVTSGVPEIPGATVLQRREFASSNEGIEFVRRLLCHEPRGHSDMYGCFLVPPDDEGASLGVLFWHKDGYSSACGHGTIALARWAIDSGLVAATPDGDTDVVFDVPSGRVVARVARRAGVPERITFRNVPSYVLARGVAVHTSRGDLQVDVSYGGAIYASLDVSTLGLQVTPDCYRDLVSIGREVKWALDATAIAKHPTEPRLSGIYGTIIYEDLGDGAEGPHQRNLTVFADGEADRSPCGSGTSARVALLSQDGRLGDGQVLTHDSIIGTRFVARIVEHTVAGAAAAVVSEVAGNAYKTADHVFVLDKRDPLGTGFVLR